MPKCCFCKSEFKRTDNEKRKDNLQKFGQARLANFEVGVGARVGKNIAYKVAEKAAGKAAQGAARAAQGAAIFAKGVQRKRVI